MTQNILLIRVLSAANTCFRSSCYRKRPSFCSIEKIGVMFQLKARQRRITTLRGRHMTDFNRNKSIEPSGLASQVSWDLMLFNDSGDEAVLVSLPAKIESIHHSIEQLEGIVQTQTAVLLSQPAVPEKNLIVLEAKMACQKYIDTFSKLKSELKSIVEGLRHAIATKAVNQDYTIHLQNEFARISFELSTMQS
jgi:hypothetical protein